MTQAMVAVMQLMGLAGMTTLFKHLSQEDFDAVAALHPGLSVETVEGNDAGLGRFYERAEILFNDVSITIFSPSRRTRERTPAPPPLRLVEPEPPADPEPRRVDPNSRWAHVEVD